MTAVTAKIVIRPKKVPRQPYFLSPLGNGSERRTRSRPINGVVITERRYAHPNPIFLLEPTSPTRTDTKVHVNAPKINNDNVILKVF